MPPAPREQQQQLDSFQRANAAYRGKDYAAARALFTEAVALAPANPSLYSNRALAHMKLGDFALAEGDSRKAIELAEKQFDDTIPY